MSSSVTDPRLAFHATYFDRPSHLTKEYLCLYYEDNTVELIDAVHGKTFLKRSACPNLHKSQFFIGADIVVFGRVLHLDRYADKVTEQLSEKTSESAIAVIGETMFEKLGDCLDIIIRECTFSICSMNTVTLRDGDWNNAAAVLPSDFSKQTVIVLHLVRDKALAKAAELPNRLKSRSVWITATKADVERAKALEEFAARRAAADLTSASTVVIIKPHVLSAKRGGEALQRLLQDVATVRISCATQLTMSGAQADAFMQPYKGILKDYRPSVEQLASSACWLIQLVSKNPSAATDVVSEVRQAVGPFDPVIAKVLRPRTLRSAFGIDCARNGFHCSDLPDDGRIDSAFFWGRRA